MKIYMNKSAVGFLNKAVTTVVAAILVFPLFAMLLGSFRPDMGDVIGLFLNEKFTLWNFEVLAGEPLLKWGYSSMFVGCLGTILAVLCNAAAGYAFAFHRIHGKKIIFGVFLFGMMIPSQVTLVPVYLMIRRFGLYGNRLSLVIPFIASAFMIFFYRQALKDFPVEVLHYAETEGAGELRKFFQILLPMTKPTLVTMAVLVFMGHWNNYLWQVVLCQKRIKTLLVGITEFIIYLSAHSGPRLELRAFANMSTMSAGAVIVFIPMVFVFVFLQKYFVKSLYQGGVT